MTYKELKRKVLVLIEEYDDDPNNKRMTADDDIFTKMYTVVNQIMYEVCRIKKIPKYIEVEVKKGDLIDFAFLEKKCGYEVYQVSLISGVKCTDRANGSIFKVLEDGTAEIDLYVYPERITEKTSDSYEFELSADVLEVMPYGIAADLLSTDVSSNYKEFQNRYESMLGRLDVRNQMPSITFEGGYN